MYRAFALQVVLAAGASGAEQKWVFDDGFCVFANQIRCLRNLASVADVRTDVIRSLQSVDRNSWGVFGIPTAPLEGIVQYIQTAPCELNVTECPVFHPWFACTDGPIAAPNSHKILLKNTDVEVLAVSVPENQREPFHTHQGFSIMIEHIGGDSGDGQRYFGADGKVCAVCPSCV
jgi:hypothetical protein